MNRYDKMAKNVVGLVMNTRQDFDSPLEGAESFIKSSECLIRQVEININSLYRKVRTEKDIDKAWRLAEDLKTIYFRLHKASQIK